MKRQQKLENSRDAEKEKKLYFDNNVWVKMSPEEKREYTKLFIVGMMLQYSNNRARR